MRMLVAFLCLITAGSRLNADGVNLLRPVNVAAVNTPADEDEPFTTFAGQGAGQLYFSRGGELFVANRSANGWGRPNAFEEIPERGDYRSLCIGLPRRNARYPQHLYYATNADRAKPDGRGDNFDIYLMVREEAEGGFQVPIPLHAISTAEDEMHPWLSDNGKLYFSRRTKDGWRVFVSSRPKPELNFGEPDLVDLPAGFFHATLTPSGTTMFLQGPVKGGRLGLFRSTLKDGKWTRPAELVELNHPESSKGDCCPSLSRTGATLYFASDRPGGKGGLDIWSISVSQLRQE